MLNLLKKKKGFTLATDSPFSRNVDCLIRGTNHNYIGQVSWDFTDANKSCFLFWRLLLNLKFSIPIIWHTLYFKHKVTIRSKIIITCRYLKQDKRQLISFKCRERYTLYSKGFEIHKFLSFWLCKEERKFT